MYLKTHGLQVEESSTKQGHVNCFFYIKGVIIQKWVSKGATVNQHNYKKVPKTL